MRWAEITRVPHPTTLHAGISQKSISYMTVYDVVLYQDHMGCEVSQLEPTKSLYMNLPGRTEWWPLFETVHAGIRSLYREVHPHLPVYSRELLASPTKEGQLVEGHSREVPNTLQLDLLPDGEVDLRYLKNTTFIQLSNGVTHFWESLIAQDTKQIVRIDSPPWLCLLQNLAPMVKMLASIIREQGK